MKINHPPFPILFPGGIGWRVTYGSLSQIIRSTAFSTNAYWRSEWINCDSERPPKIAGLINGFCVYVISILLWCWWNFLTQPIRSLKLGHVTGQGSMSPNWVGWVSHLGKNDFHQNNKNLDNIAVYLIASLKLKWENKQIKNMNNWIW